MRSVLVLLAGLAVASPAVGQVVYVDPVAPGHPDGPRPIFDPAWSVDLLVGAPTGIRLQRTLDGTDPDHPWAAEGFVGVHAIFPAFGGGVRKTVSRAWSGWDQFVVAPGVDAFLLINPDRDVFGGAGALPFVTFDVDLVWRHEFYPGGCGEVGVKLGAGVGFGERIGVLPVVALFGGWRF